MGGVDRNRAFGRFWAARTGFHACNCLGSALGLSEARLD